MFINRIAILAGAAVAVLLANAPASALTMAECSAKYNAAKAAGTLNGQSWNQFRKAECGAQAAATRKPEKRLASLDGPSGGKRLTMAECSARYKAAKSAGTLNGMKWNDFRKAECGAAAAEDLSAPSLDEVIYRGEPEKPSKKAPRGVSFPSTISSKYANETPAKARMRTCLEHYYANKDAGTLNGLRWIQKGGGYYSLCNARLRG